MSIFKDYTARFAKSLSVIDFPAVERLASDLKEVRDREGYVYVCGNGGSAGNAIHWGNDFIYPVRKGGAGALKIMSLVANPATLTCIANDLGYDEIFSYQIESMGKPGDYLIALSGSGNSKNIVKALKAAKTVGMRSCAIVGFDGGEAKRLADLALHFPVEDMQIAEDLQILVNHMVMLSLS